MTIPPSTTGPLGQPRGIGFGILMYIVTLGIYSFYWVFKTQEEIKNHSGIGVGGVLGLVIWIVAGFVTIFLIPSDIGIVSCCGVAACAEDAHASASAPATIALRSTGPG